MIRADCCQDAPVLRHGWQEDSRCWVEIRGYRLAPATDALRRVHHLQSKALREEVAIDAFRSTISSRKNGQSTVTFARETRLLRSQPAVLSA
jgi:hypothetical protein